MKPEKYLITIALTVLLAGVLAGPALASTTITQGTPPDYKGTGGTKLEAGVSTSYRVVIPEKLEYQELTADSTDAERKRALPVKVEKLMLAPDKQLTVRVAGSGSNNSFTLAHSAVPAVSLPYKLWNTDVNSYETPGSLQPGDVMARFTNSSQDPVSGTVILDKPAMGAGSYTGQLTFTCTVEATTP